MSLLLGSAGSVPVLAGSGLSTETLSQVEDPADPTSGWLLDSPLRESAPPTALSPMRGMVMEDGAPSAMQGPGLGLLQPNAALVVMRKSLEAEAVEELALDLRKESTAAVSLVRGKRTKVVTTGTVLTKSVGSRARKSSRLTGGASSTSALEKAKRRTAERNLDSDAGMPDSFSVLDLLPDSHLSSIISDSCIVFVPSAGSPGEALSLLRAKEKVQAALAEVALCKEQESAARAAREAAAAARSATSEVGTSTAEACLGGEALADPLLVPPEVLAPSQSTPREGANCSAVPSPPGRVWPRVSRVTRSVTRAMLAVRKGSKGKAAK
jgi:hypothetical protein